MRPSSPIEPFDPNPSRVLAWVLLISGAALGVWIALNFLDWP